MDKLIKIPTLSELIEETPSKRDETALMVILNQNPHEKWIKTLPAEMTNGKEVKYLPIERVEYLLNRIYGGYNVEVKSVQIMANSVQMTVRVHVINPLTGDEEYQDGVGACAIQTEKGASATDISKVKSNGVMLATPAAKSEAIKDACHHFGRIFGRDIMRRDISDYNALLKPQTTEQELKTLYDQKKHLFSPEECKRFEDIMDKKEVNSYFKLQNALNSRQ